jgi:type IV secretory pathway VirB4 component
MFNVGVYSNRRSRGVGEYQRRPAILSDLLPWAFFLGKGLIVNKDGALQKTIAFRGPDLASSTKEQLVATRGRVNNALRRLGSSWCLHIEARRRPAPQYPESSFPDRYSAVVEDERRRAFEERSIPAFESDYFLTFTYLPPAERVGRAEAAMMENAQRASGGLYAVERTRFLDVVENIVAILAGC